MLSFFFSIIMITVCGEHGAKSQVRSSTFLPASRLVYNLVPRLFIKYLVTKPRADTSPYPAPDITLRSSGDDEFTTEIHAKIL